MSGRALLVGASGQVGTQMLRYFEQMRGPGYAVPTSRDIANRPGWLALDLAKLDAVSTRPMLAPYPLDAIFCIAGMTDVERCESEPEQAEGANTRGPAMLAAYARELGVPFVYYSTEYVFDGDSKRPGPYAEDAPTHPLSVYGRSKLEGELAVMRAHPDALVLRTTVVYGPDEREKNYVYSLMRALAAGRPMRVPADQISTPTYNRDLVRTTVGLLKLGASGIVHVCGPELLSRIDFARQVAEFLGLDASLLEPLPTSDLGQRAPRPLDAGLATDLLRRQYPKLPMRTVAEGLRDCEPELERFLHGLRQEQRASVVSR